jgi:ribonuclease Y
MSGMGAPAPPSLPTTTGGVAEALLSLAAFVQKPEHVDRVRELQAAEQAANEARAAADQEQNHARNLLAHQRELQAELDAATAAHLETVTKTKESITARELAVQKAEADLAARKREFDAEHAFQIGDHTKRSNALATRQLNVEQRERELSAREAALAQREANVADTETELQQAISRRRR